VRIYIGTSGWSYRHWEDVLYPPGLPSWQRLDHYIRHFSTVEVNSTYYRWPQSTTFTSWEKQLPDGFLMSVKAPRLLTHYSRLYAPERWLARVAVTLQRLQQKLGVLLVQLPPQMEYDHARLSYFLQIVPSWIKVAIELRHPSWHREAVFSLLEQYGAAYCVISGAQLPCILRATTGFVYVRLHGPDPQHLYTGSYSDADMQWWAERIREWQAQNREVFAYFNNDGGGNAVRNAKFLQELLND
jgi:uncharacterized protein YecE (DUF72 family)